MPKREMKALQKSWKAQVKERGAAQPEPEPEVSSAPEPEYSSAAVSTPETEISPPAASDWETPWWEDRQPTFAD